MPKSNKPWTHIPDSWIGAAISCRISRESLEQVWQHLAKCEACRDRYWETAQNAVKATPQPMVAIPLNPDMADMPGPLKSFLGALMGGMHAAAGSGSQMTWDEAMLKMMAHAEQLGDEPLTYENMEIEGLMMPSDDLEHNEGCRQCQGIINAYIAKLEERKTKMPDKIGVIDKMIAYFKSLQPVQKKKEKAEEKAAPSNGEPNSFAM